MTNFQVNRVLDIKAGLGEGVLWSVEEQALFWLDGHIPTLNRFDPKSGKNSAWPLPAHPGCFAFHNKSGAIVATRAGYYNLDFASGALELLTPPPFDAEIFRFNDGKTDRQGRFWVGTVYNKNPLEHTGGGAYFRYENGVAIEGFGGIAIANGTAFSPDGRTMYVADTMTRTIYAFEYDPKTGAASNRRVFAVMPEGFGLPDGAAVDAEGGYWVAAPFGPKTGAIVRFTADGVFDLHVDVPVLTPTIVAFGGPNLSTLYVTSGRIEHLLKREPISEWSGDIFAIETPFRGLPDALYKMP
jgi:sugar lactone lactonase YvrE